MTATSKPQDIRIEGKGHIRSREVEQARLAMEKVIEAIADPVLSVKVLLVERPNFDVAHRARAEASINIKGDWVRAHTSAPSMYEAITAMEAKLRDQVRHRSDRYRHDPAGRPATPGEWRHGNLRAARPPFFERPIDARELMRHKTFATPTATVEEAIWDMSQLDYDFFLFRDEATDADALVMVDDGDPVVRSITEAPSLDVDGAIDWLNNSGDQFVFFDNTENGRGAVVYRRYDGHYGLLTPR